MASTLRPRERKHVKFIIPPKKEAKYPVLGDDIIKNLYSAAAIRGPPGTGKTNLIMDILHAKCGPKTSVIIFSPSTNIDDSWQFILKWLKKNHIKHAVHATIVDAEGNDLIEAFKKMFDTQREADEQEKNGGSEHGLVTIAKPTALGGGYGWGAPKPEKKKFYKTIDPYLIEEGGELREYPPNIVLFDDMGGKMRNQVELEDFIRRYRHYRSLVVFSSQDFIDNSPSVRNMIRDWFLFKSIHPKRLKEIYETVSPAGFTEEQFIRFYQRATLKPHAYMHIDVVNQLIDVDGQEEISMKDTPPTA